MHRIYISANRGLDKLLGLILNNPMTINFICIGTHGRLSIKINFLQKKKASVCTKYCMTISPSVKPMYPYSRESQNLHCLSNKKYKQTTKPYPLWWWPPPIKKVELARIACILTNNVIKLCNLAEQSSNHQH